MNELLLAAYINGYNDCSAGRSYDPNAHSYDIDGANQWSLACELTIDPLQDFIKTGVSVERYLEALAPNERNEFLAFIDSVGRFIFDILGQDDKYVDDFISYHS